MSSKTEIWNFDPKKKYHISPEPIEEIDYDVQLSSKLVRKILNKKNITHAENVLLGSFKFAKPRGFWYSCGDEWAKLITSADDPTPPTNCTI